MSGEICAVRADYLSRTEYETGQLCTHEQMAESNKRIAVLEEEVEELKDLLSKVGSGAQQEDKLYLELKTRGTMSRKEVSFFLGNTHPEGARRVMLHCEKRYEDATVVKDLSGKLHITINERA